MLQLRCEESRTLGFAPLLRKLGYDMGFESIVMWGCAALYLTTLSVDPAGIRNIGISFFAEFPQPLHVRRQRSLPRIHLRTLVDDPQRRLAARQSAAHYIQSDVGSAQLVPPLPSLRNRPHGNYLHDFLRSRISVKQHDRIPVRRYCPEFPGRSTVHYRSISPHLRSAWGSRALWSASRKQRHLQPGDGLCGRFSSFSAF